MTGKLGRVDAKQADAFVAASDRVAIGNPTTTQRGRVRHHPCALGGKYRGDTNKGSGSDGDGTNQGNMGDFHSATMTARRVERMKVGSGGWLRPSQNQTASGRRGHAAQTYFARAALRVGRARYTKGSRGVRREWLARYDARFSITFLCSQTFIVALSLVSPV